ncbi:MAG TPA: prepilin-type N-terminal cleavage/methylation domain-containing protein [Bacillota bacterium]|nr:prepilin-type N-terminal cleavage/methylation domain-containing protein [Bacillota bacterium]
MKFILSEKGFTFLEMCMVVVIISVLMLLAVPNYQKAVAKAQSKTCEANKSMIEAQIESYYLDNHVFPTPDNANTEVNEVLVELKTKQYLKEEPKCPSNGKYTITMNTTDHTISVTCDQHPE